MIKSDPLNPWLSGFATAGIIHSTVVHFQSGLCRDTIRPSNERNDYIMDTIGTRIGRLRRRNGLTQEDLAVKLGVTPQAVSKWENDISCPDIMILPSLA